MTENDRKDTTQPIKEALQSITIHGLPHLLQEELKCMKIAWFLIFIGAASYMAVLIHARVEDYRKYEVYMQSTSRIMQPIPFPAVTVCNSDRFSAKPFEAFPMGNLTCDATGNRVQRAKLSAAQEAEFKIACKTFLSGYKDTMRFGDKNIHSFPNDFQSSSGLYPCFTFNQIGLSKQEVNGAGMGFNILLFNDPSDTVGLTTANASRFDDQRRGILIQIHDPETMATMNPAASIVILPGHSYDIVISRKTISRKKHPFSSNCHTKETTLYKQIQGRYTRYNCIFSCFQMKLQKLCGSVSTQNKSAAQIACESELYKQRPIGDCVCPEACYEVRYQPQIVANIWPRMLQLQTIKKEFASLLNSTDTAYIQKRFAKVKIYYDQLINTDDTEEELYGISSLISEIGGLMGLFLGCSVISLAELLWLFGLSMKSLVMLPSPRRKTSHVKMEGNGHTVELGSVNTAC